MIHIGPLARGAAQTPGLCHHVTAAGGILALFDALPQAVEILEAGGGLAVAEDDGRDEEI